MITISDKIIPLNEVRRLSEYLRKDGHTIVTTNGVFDIIHAGHVQYLTDAKLLGDVLIVGVNSDASARLVKGNTRPIMPLARRLKVLEALEPIDFIVVYDDMLPNVFIAEVRPHFHVKGGDYTNKDIQEAELLKTIGAELIITNYYYDESVTNIVQQILDQYKFIDIHKIFQNIVKKDWGYEFWLHNSDICYKILVLNGGWQGSLHYHGVKNEKFTIMNGKVKLEIGTIDENDQYQETEVIELSVGDTKYVNNHKAHRFTSLSDISVILEESTHHDDNDTHRITKAGKIDQQKEARRV